jgi:imidazolonepropionase-like amidohydrolase/Tol biopolymer transport system component
MRPALQRILVLASAVAVAVAVGFLPDSALTQETPLREVRVTTDEVTDPDVAVLSGGEGLVFTLLGHLYRIPIEGGIAEQLTHGPYYDKEPAVSPDGTRIAFVSDRGRAGDNLMVLSLDSGEIEELTFEAEAARPSWSPDGTQVAYLAFDKPRRIEPWWFFRPPTSQVRIVNLATGQAETLTPKPAEYHGVAFAPDGTLYWSRVEWEKGCQGCSRSRIEAWSAEGSVREFVVRDGVIDYLTVDSESGALFYRKFLTAPLHRRPSSIYRVEEVSGPDLLVFEGDAMVRFHWGQAFGVEPGGSSIYTGDYGHLWRGSVPAGSRLPILFEAQATNTNAVGAPAPPLPTYRGQGPAPVRVVAGPALSPDGSQILFTAAGMLWRQSLDNPDAVPERIDDGPAYDPVFAPDGESFAYVRETRTGGELVVSEGVPGTRRVLAQGVPWAPIWTADGTGIVVMSRGGLTLVTVADGTEQTLVPSGYWSRASISSDGAWVYATRHDGDVFRISTERSADAVELTALNGQSRNAIVSPDGRWLVFRRNAEIWVSDLHEALPGDSIVTEDEITRLSAAGGMGGITFTAAGDAVVFVEGPRIFHVTLPHGTPEEIPVSLALPAAPRPPMVLQNVRVLEPAGTGFSEPLDLYVEDGRIVSMGQAPATFDRSGATVLDGEGRFVVPGLWDAHAHAGVVGENYQVLTQGITSIRDAGSPILAAIQELDRERAMSEAFPRRFTPGEIFEGPNGDWWDWWNHIATEEDARNHVRLWRELGARFIKVYRSVPWDLQRVIAQEARIQGLPLMGHGMKAEAVVRSVMLGFRSVEHSPFPQTYHDDILGLLAESGTYWDPTLVERGAVMTVRLREDPRKTREAAERLGLSGTGERAVYGIGYGTSDYLGALQAQLESLRSAHERGVQLLVGSDGGGGMYGVHLEMEGLQDAGIPAADIIRMATLGIAVSEGVDADLGTLEVGKLADLILLDKNPLETVLNARLPWRVIKDGLVVHERQD